MEQLRETMSQFKREKEKETVSVMYKTMIYTGAYPQAVFQVLYYEKNKSKIFMFQACTRAFCTVIPTLITNIFLQVIGVPTAPCPKSYIRKNSKILQFLQPSATIGVITSYIKT